VGCEHLLQQYEWSRACVIAHYAALIEVFVALSKVAPNTTVNSRLADALLHVCFDAQMQAASLERSLSSTPPLAT